MGYLTKRTTIDKWMQSDRTKQERFDNAESGEFYCKTCSVLLEETDKHLHDHLNEELKVLFLYKCPKCGKREGYYDNGKAYESKPTLCDKCASEVDVSLKIDNKNDITTWTYKCTGCDYKKIDVDDHKKWKEEHDLKEKKDKEFLEKFRKDFCFTEEEGNHAVQRSENLSNLMRDIKSREDQKKDPVYQKAISLNKLKVVEVNKLLKEAFEKEGFIELQFEKPEMGRFVAVPFVVQDGKPERNDYDSKTTLKKLISGVLESTNWRLMSEGISYRVGYLSGNLRCYENAEELAEALKK
jgi:Zn finger protein HypA/HybF involved in hydrogenase expression